MPKKVPTITDEMREIAEAQIFAQKERIDYYMTEYSIEMLAQKMNTGSITIPEYQREFTWDINRQSRFIESILMGLPIPFLFFWENKDNGKLEVVDGSQRLRTIQHFLNGKMRLAELEKLTHVSGFGYNDFQEHRRLKLGNRSIRGIVLNEHADEEARLDLFDRINTSSKTANKAEIRRGSLSGPFLDLVISLAKNATFIELAPVPEKKVKEREREELVTRFFAYGDGLVGYNDEVSRFLFDYSKKMNEKFSSDTTLVEAYRERFVSTMDFIRQFFPYGFKRAVSGNVTPRARFESIAIGCYLALKENPDIQPNHVDIATWIESESFKKIIGSDGANAIGRLTSRMEYIKKRLLGEAHE